MSNRKVNITTHLNNDIHDQQRFQNKQLKGKKVMNTLSECLVIIWHCIIISKAAKGLINSEQVLAESCEVHNKSSLLEVSVPKK